MLKNEVDRDAPIAILGENIALPTFEPQLRRSIRRITFAAS